MEGMHLHLSICTQKFHHKMQKKECFFFVRLRFFGFFIYTLYNVCCNALSIHLPKKTTQPMQRYICMHLSWYCTLHFKMSAIYSFSLTHKTASDNICIRKNSRRIMNKMPWEINFHKKHQDDNRYARNKEKKN